MSDKEFIEATARQIAEMEQVLNEAEAALDIEGRARAAGIDYAAVMVSMEQAAKNASPQVLAEAKRLREEEEAQYKDARAKAISALSRSASTAAPAVPRRPRNMA